VGSEEEAVHIDEWFDGSVVASYYNT
jgi:hypothetical protein